jgi:cell filamentation protein
MTRWLPNVTERQASYVVLDPYVYPGTDVLKNKADYTHPDLWAAFELDMSLSRMTELKATPIEGDFDFEHMKRIHGYLFQDVYEWAGEPRTIDISEAGHRYYPASYMASGAAEHYGKLATQNHLKGLPRKQFLDQFADTWGEINVVHNFREGNTRSQQVFFSQLAQEAGWPMDFGQVDYEAFIQARYHQMDTGSSEQMRAVLDPAVSQSAADNDLKETEQSHQTG